MGIITTRHSILLLAVAVTALAAAGCGGDSTPDGNDSGSDVVTPSDTGVGSDADSASDGAATKDTGSDVVANGDTGSRADAADTGTETGVGGGDAGDGGCQEFSAFVLDLVNNHTNATEQPVPTEGRCFTDNRDPAAYNSLFP